ncbi:helix-turn-helix transcriptional regulator [Candidatus Poribacteria bacterium]|nr:helix-turn-helix transcriptional regulator [Candidatus Poribacteria bacterium]
MPKRGTVVNAQLGWQVRELRERRGRLMDELASEAGVNRKTISRIENIKDDETREFYTTNLHQIAQALRTTLAELLNGLSPEAKIEPEWALENCEDQQGELLRDCQTGAIYWVQNKIHPVPNFDVLNHMKAHGMPGWDGWRNLPWVSGIKGPLFYHKNANSNGLLIKFYGQPLVFLIHNAQKHQIGDTYTFENYTYQDRFLEWHDIISMPEPMANGQFPTGSPIQMAPSLSSPANGTTLNEPTVTLHSKPHENPSWKYHLQAAPGPDFTSPVYDRVSASLNVAVKNLDAGQYFWRMRGDKDGRTPSVWSEAWSFTVSFPDDPS